MKNRLSKKIFEMEVVSDKFLEAYPLAQKYRWKTPGIKGLMFLYPPQVKFNESERITARVVDRHGLISLDPTELSEPALEYALSLFRPYHRKGAGNDHTSRRPSFERA